VSDTTTGQQLGPREIQTLRHMARDMSVGQIAASMGVSRGSVRSYIRSIYTKWGTATRADMIRIGRRLGYVTDACPTCGRRS
jgi:DNA-binding CsgD family transcriptional regulator